MKMIHNMFSIAYLVIVLFFFVCGVSLCLFAGYEVWQALNPMADSAPQARFSRILECIGLLTIAVASLELGQTVLEEEVRRTATMSAPTRVRRFLSRFMIVVIVSLSIECLVAVFQFIHSAPDRLPEAASIGIAAAMLLAAWGVFISMNVKAEELEPQAMKKAKAEDDKVEDAEHRQ